MALRSPKSADSNGNTALPSIRVRIAKASNEPGVYRWLDKEGNVLYVGKAKNLKNRLKSYVAPDGMKSQGPWKMSLASQIHDFDVIVTNNELEALLLETNLIKEKKPKYNVLMKDDKHHVYLKVEVKDPYPRIDVVRRMEDDKAKYFGPFLTAYELRNTLDMLHRVLGYRTCAHSLDVLNKDPTNTAALKSCLESQIGQCNGLCMGKITQEEYRSRIDALMSFFKGNYDPVIDRTKTLMQEAATNRKFERAAEFRNVLAYIESLKEKQIVSDTSNEDMDAIGVALLSNKAQIVLLRKRNGKLLSEYQLALQGLAEDAATTLAQFMSQYYADTPDIPGKILVSDEIPDSALLEKWLSGLRGGKVIIHVPERGKKSSLLDLAMKNADLKAKQSEAKWESESRNLESALEELKNALSLKEIPKRIEGYDISHHGGTETVGSMVVFHDGKPKRDHYRTFTIKSLGDGTVDDYKSLAEVLRRRLKYLVYSFEKEEAEWKEKEITASRAKKSDSKFLAEKLSHKKEEKFEYADFFVLYEKDSTLGFAQLKGLQKQSYELLHLWIEKDDRRGALLHFLLRRITKSVKKGKIYAHLDSSDEQLFSEVGFRHVHTPPSFIAADPKKTLFVFDSLQNKIDPSFTTFPDLLLIDGGKGQLNAVCDVLKDMHLEIPVAGLAKRLEEVFLPGQSHSVSLASTSPASFLLQRLRDEAHRFANYQREGKGSKALIQSELDAISGIGPKTRTDLLKKFGSVARIKEASDKELSTILTSSQLLSLREALKKDTTNSL